MKGRGKLPPEERPAAGKRINHAKEKLEEALKARREAIQQKELKAQLDEEGWMLPCRGVV